MKLEPKKILEGLTNSVFLKAEVEKIARERLKICSGCDYDSKKRKTGGLHQCLYCSCLLKWKTRSLSSSCPLPQPRWEAVEGIDHDLSNQIDELTGNE